jgi:hypothetical protein
MPVVAHELTHDRQMGRGWRRWAWTLRYLVDPWFRLRVEVEAEVAEYVTRANMLDRWPHVVHHGLGGWRLPYMTPGDPEEIGERIKSMAMEVRDGCD